MDDENHPVMEGIHELTLNTPVDELMVLCDPIIDFKTVKDNGFNFSETLEFQGWKGFFERLTGHVYPVLVKQFLDTCCGYKGQNLFLHHEQENCCH